MQDLSSEEELGEALHCTITRNDILRLTSEKGEITLLGVHFDQADARPGDYYQNVFLNLAQAIALRDSIDYFVRTHPDTPSGTTETDGYLD